MPIGPRATLLSCFMLATTSTSVALWVTNTTKHTQPVGPVEVTEAVEPKVCGLHFDAKQGAWYCNTNVTSRGSLTRKKILKLSKCSVIPTSLSYSGDYNEDMDLYNYYFCNKKGGTYFEVNAMDGAFLSDTKLFEDQLGWGGGLVSPYNQNELNEIKAYRNTKTNILFTEGICATAGRMDLDVVTEEGGKFLQKRVNIPCRPLGAMMKETLKQTRKTRFDFCSLSVDGGEEVVLKTMDWSIPVDVWVIEMDGTNNIKDQNVRELLFTNGYIKALFPFDSHNEFFVYNDSYPR